MSGMGGTYGRLADDDEVCARYSYSIIRGLFELMPACTKCCSKFWHKGLDPQTYMPDIMLTHMN